MEQCSLLFAPISEKDSSKRLVRSELATATMDTTLLARDALSGFKYYYYSPSMAAAIIFIALFGITTAMHSAQMVRGRTWLMIPFLIGGVCTSSKIFSQPAIEY